MAAHPAKKLYVVEGERLPCGTLTGDEGGCTISTDPAVHGWETDSGHSGYCLTREWATQIVTAANAHDTLVEALRTIAGYTPGLLAPEHAVAGMRGLASVALNKIGEK